jgi:hypothetical protein
VIFNLHCFTLKTPDCSIDARVAAPIASISSFSLITKGKKKHKKDERKKRGESIEAQWTSL